MKSWVLIPLVMFITIAGYHFGYYRAKLEYSDANKQRIATALEKSTQNTAENDMGIFGPAKLQAAELSPATLQSTGKKIPLPSLAEANVAPYPNSSAVPVAVLEEATQRKRAEREADEIFLSAYRSDLDIAVATQITDFFQLHPQSAYLNLQSIKCNIAHCQLTGQYDGPEEDFNGMINDLTVQEWYRYGVPSSKLKRDGDTTYFILKLSSPS